MSFGKAALAVALLALAGCGSSKPAPCDPSAKALPANETPPPGFSAPTSMPMACDGSEAAKPKR